MAITTDYGELLADPEIQAVVVTAPTPAHYELAKAALLTGRHVFVEKPIALAVDEAEDLAALAEARGRVLMVGHLLMYHPAVARLKQMMDGGELGEVYYLYASRLNLGQVRRSENAMWSLAPHDISVALYLLGEEPVAVAAQGLTYLQPGIPDTVFLTLRFASGRAAHIHVSWLDPHKVRRITVVGSQKMAVFDDVDSTEKLRIYDKGVQRPAYDSYGDSLSLRFGDISIPRIDMREPLRLECQHFIDCILNGQTPLSDGRNGVQVLRVLEAGQRSLERGGEPVVLERS
jgi:predicted dehydrogenase